MLKDGVILEDEDNRVVLNQYSLCELAKYILTHYVGISYEKASESIENSTLVEPIKSVMEASLIAHEYIYYWAMSSYYGHMYWKKGIAAQPENLEAYFEFEDRMISGHGLQEPLIWSD